MTWGRPFLWDTCSRPSSDRGMVTHLLGCPGLLRAFSKSSMAPFFFFSFFTRASTAFSAHFSSSSPCFHPSNRFTAGLVKENRLDMEVIVPICTRKWDLKLSLPAVCQEDDYVCVCVCVWEGRGVDKLSLAGPRTGSWGRTQLLVLRKACSRAGGGTGSQPLRKLV